METGPIRVAIMADTHGVLRPEVERILETCDVIVHAGDFDNQMLYHKLNVDQPLYAVRGNNDRGWSGGLGQVNRFEIGGVKFIMREWISPACLRIFRWSYSAILICIISRKSAEGFG